MSTFCIAVRDQNGRLLNQEYYTEEGEAFGTFYLIKRSLQVNYTLTLKRQVSLGEGWELVNSAVGEERQPTNHINIKDGKGGAVQFEFKSGLYSDRFNTLLSKLLSQCDVKATVQYERVG